YDLTVVPNPSDETQYGIQITGVPSSICKMVGDGLKQTVAVYVGNEDYDSDTKEDPCDESDNNTMEFYFDTGAVESDGCKTDADCGTNKYCDMDTGICFRGDKPEGSHGVCTTTNECCTAGQFPYTTHGDDCSTDTIANGMCYYGTCIAKGCTYDKNQCTGKTYCASPNDSCTEAFPSDQTGTCVEADFAKLYVGDKTYYVSHHYMSWWDADAACKALGRDGLVEVDDLITGWNGGYDWVNHELTTLGTALKNHFGTGHEYIWTNDLAANSCDAYRVGADDGRVDDGDRNYYNYTEYPSYAVCR
ncbi:MAG: hypothetical protein IJV75_00930, partial [Alphaproteobacteria bacterium]|nr:hypothetical protein [Alphaproteobacteria bacterium]